MVLWGHRLFRHNLVSEGRISYTVYKVFFPYIWRALSNIKLAVEYSKSAKIWNNILPTQIQSTLSFIPASCFTSNHGFFFIIPPNSASYQVHRWCESSKKQHSLLVQSDQGRRRNAPMISHWSVICTDLASSCCLYGAALRVYFPL